ncbi:hypothetical protein HOY82DRAFT_535876 [Tuber indicum]|nr:hypothetical protein HOY82DRAFT_535876 [Tuber indicum]
MAPPTPSKSADLNALPNDPVSTTSARISSSSSSSSVRRSGRNSAKAPINYREKPKRNRRNANPQATPLAKRQKLSNTSPPATPAAVYNQIPNAPSGTNTPNQSPVITDSNTDTPSIRPPTATQTTKCSTSESATPTPQSTPSIKASPLPYNLRSAGIPRFTRVQIRNLLLFNSTQISPGNAGPPPRPSFPAASANMSISIYHLRALARAAAAHYASLPREYGNLESCLPHLYKTFIPTVEFERWAKESGGGMGEGHTHDVLMKVFEIVFLGRFSCVEAKERIWELLGFEEVEEEGEGEGEHQGETDEH